MKSEDIILKIKELKITKQKIFSNCFISFNTMMDKEWIVYCGERSIVIQDKDGDINRLYFYTLDFEDLDQVINANSLDGVIEIISKNRQEYEQELARCGYIPLTHMKRIACKDITPTIDNTVDYSTLQSIEGFYFADSNDTDDIYNLLWETFDTRISHLPNHLELKQMINRKEFIIHRNNYMKIDSLLQYQISPKSYYVNQIINHGDKVIFHNMVKYTLQDYIIKGGKYAFAWVEENNVASLNFFLKYGITADGVWNTIYTKNRVG